ncbi:hypothetical protein [Cucumibacter marinus]|uniref:hypothetical protein n=1 Tax=Cucumibacter marinus TaxID=1121252 RepID=UPI000404B2AD|nr:hypothetical protein [Cucumibacter marinus]
MMTVEAARMPQFIAENSNVLIFFHDDAPAEALALGATLGDTPGAWQAGLVDVAAAPEIRSAFGLRAICRRS